MLPSKFYALMQKNKSMENNSGLKLKQKLAPCAKYHWFNCSKCDYKFETNGDLIVHMI